MAKDIDGKKIAAGDKVISITSHKPHIIINTTEHLIMYKNDNGTIAYRPSDMFRKVG